MGEFGESPGSGVSPSGPRVPLGHPSSLGVTLSEATDVDAVARAVLRDLVSLPGVARAGIALSEGGGRRLRFLSSDTAESASPAWCHIDAYDDVPLTAVVRTGEPVLGDLDGLAGRFAGVVERQRSLGTRALAALPLPGSGSPIGGLVVFFDEEQQFAAPQRRLLEAAARRTAEAVRRVRSRAASEAAEESGAQETTEVATLLLDDDPRAAGRARQFLRDLLDQWQIGGDVPDTAQLCTSELVTNAVIHAGTTSVLTVGRDEAVLTVAVRDRGARHRADVEPTVQLVEDDDPLRVFGRGLQLVDALADSWGAEQDAGGTTTWFALEIEGESAQAG